MGSFKLGGMTFGSLFKKPETLLYPFETKTPYQMQKGHIVIEPENCILCGICAKSCPCSCITVDKKQRTWEINAFMCVQCATCVRACPKTCLEMDPACPPVSGDIFTNIFDVPEKEKVKDE